MRGTGRWFGTFRDSSPKGATRQRPPRALIVDDDSWSLRFLEVMLVNHFPELIVESRQTPDLSGDHDLYFIDNDFDGRELAGEMAAKIRRTNPDALVIAFSATLGRRSLKELVNAGCDGACDKSMPGDLDVLIETTSRYLRGLRH